MRLNRALLCLAVCSASCSLVGAADWPQFLGPGRNGISPETNLVSTFPKAGPGVLWRTDLGVGQSGIAVSDGTVYTLFQDDDSQYVVALDEATGDRKWLSGIADAYENAMGNGPRATPVIVDQTVCVFTGEGILAALATATGDVNWQVDTTQKLDARPAGYGMASSPLVINGTVIVHIGSANGTVAAYSLETGDMTWAAGSDACGYSSPVQMTFDGSEQIVTFSAESVMGISPVSGEPLWQYPFVTDYDCNIAAPIQVNDSSLLISAGENHGAVLLTVTQSDDGWSVNETWASLGKRSVLRAEWQTPVLLDGHVFGLDNVGAAGPITNLVCINALSGEAVWSKKRFGKSNLTLGDGKLFISTVDGELVIVEATAEGFRETARARVLGMTRQAPVIANGRLYLRDDREIVCIDVRAQG
ncbi:MAG: PQQ-binding-like beta-propeller repeat protein [Planctomycetaceae bacterium]